MITRRAFMRGLAALLGGGLGLAEYLGSRRPMIDVRRFGFPDGYDPAAVQTALSDAGYTSTQGYGDRGWWIFKVETTEANRAAVEAIIDGEVDSTSGTPVAAGSVLASAGEMALIEDIELSGDTATFDFQNIPGTYRALKLVCMIRTDAGAIVDDVLIRFNNDSGANYDYVQVLEQQPAVFNATGSSGEGAGKIGRASGDTATAGRFNRFEVDILFYADITSHKQAHSLGVDWPNTAIRGAEHYTGWASTAAITRITLLPMTGTNFKSGSRCVLYGVR